MAQLAQVILTQPLEEVLRRGHPWVWVDALQTRGLTLPSGAIVDVVNRQGEFVGRGVYDANSPLRVRLWTLDPEQDVDDALLVSRIKQARRRRAFPDAMTTGYRLLNGEGDRVPGLVCDVYGEVAVLRPDGEAAERWVAPAREAIGRLLPIKHWVVRRAAIYSQGAPVASWLGAPAPQGPVVSFLEHGMSFTCDVLEGQKTGFFLDQRENRRRVAALSVGKRMLNLFGYTGGFSVAAALAGASRTTTVDLAAPAIATARHHFELNGLDPEHHDFVVADAFEYLDSLPAGKAPFEVAVCDPPSFAHRRKDVERASDAYQRLFAALLRAMPTGSTIVLASCSSHIDRGLFLELVARAQQAAQVSLVLQGVYAADQDHPVLPGFAQGDYLQCAIGTLARD